MSRYSKLASIIPAAAIAAAGTMATTPAQAATPYITASTAGVKLVNATTYVWGSTNAAPGSKICSQVLIGSSWATSQCSTVQSNGSYALPLTYDAGSPVTHTFRVVDGSLTSAPVALTRVRSITTAPTAPTNPTSPTAPTAPTAPTTTTLDHGTVTGNGYTLYSGYNGVKVYLAQKALNQVYPAGNPLHLAMSPTSTTIGPATSRALIAFRKSHGLPATAVLDQATWDALPIATDDQGVKYPFNIDSWSATSQVLASAPRDVKVAAEISFAKAQLGKPYIWGGTGPVGFDCSGLLLQASRAAGMNPTGVSNLTDISPRSALANGMWHDSEFQRGSLSNLQLGDFIYYGGSNDAAGHVAMYIGNNTVINAIGSSVQYSSLSSNAGWSRKLGVNRAIGL